MITAEGFWWARRSSSRSSVQTPKLRVFIWRPLPLLFCLNRCRTDNSQDVCTGHIIKKKGPRKLSVPVLRTAREPWLWSFPFSAGWNNVVRLKEAVAVKRVEQTLSLLNYKAAPTKAGDLMETCFTGTQTANSADHWAIVQRFKRSIPVVVMHLRYSEHGTLVFGFFFCFCFIEEGCLCVTPEQLWFKKTKKKKQEIKQFSNEHIGAGDQKSEAVCC